MLNKNTYFQTVPLVAREFIVAPFPYSLIPKDFINMYYPENKGIREEGAGGMPATKGVLENRGFFDIQYNSLNLPRLIQIYNPSAEARNEYTYSAAGAKLRVVQRVNPYYFTVPVTGSDVNTSLMIQNDTTDYIGNMIYENGALKEILTPEGYWQNGVYYYDLKDHLGNNRVVIDSTGTIVEKSHYYPSGMRFQESTSNSAALPYRYGGKELEAVNGLNQYDFEARRRFACIPVTTTMDPLCEKYYPISPYAWCGNNPVKYVDPDGRFIGTILGTIIGGASGAYKAYKNGTDVLAGAAEGAVAGAITGAAIDGAVALTVATGGGALVVIGAGVVAGAAGGAAGAIAGDVTGQVVTDVRQNNVSVGTAISRVSTENFASKAESGAVTGAISGLTQGILKVVGEAATASTKAVQATMSNNITTTATTLTTQETSQGTVNAAVNNITKGMSTAGSNTVNSMIKVEAATTTVTETAIQVTEDQLKNKGK